MIPLKLELTNFLSYQQTAVLDFNGINLACISGQNGAGKSSLLEGMVWALFGRSRSSSDDDVVNRLAAVRGEPAEVRFTFGLEEAVYRVVRKRKRGGRGSLEFQLRSGESWRALSETKMRETQTTIEQTLNMNYDTFVNVSFFLQGQADAFTTQTAGKRKELLAELLGVDQWDAYKEVAGDRRKGLENDLRLLDARMGDIATELLERDEREAMLAALQAESDGIKVQLDAQEVLVRGLRQAADAVARQMTVIDALGIERGESGVRVAELEATVAKRLERREQYATVLADKETLTRLQSEFGVLQAQFDQLQTQANQVNGLVQAQRPFELAIETARGRLETRRDGLREEGERVAQLQGARRTWASELDGLKNKVGKVDEALGVLEIVDKAYQAAREAWQQAVHERELVTQQVVQLEKEDAAVEQGRVESGTVAERQAASRVKIEQLTMGIEKLQGQRVELTTLKAETAALTTSEQPRLNDLMKKMKSRMERLKASTGELCPLCGQPLTESHLTAVLTDLQREGTGLGNDYRANQKRLATMTGRIAELDGAVREAGTLDGKLQREQQVLAQAEARLSEIERVASEWLASGKAQKLATLRAISADQDELAQLKDEVDRLADEVAGKAALNEERPQLARQIAEIETKLEAAEQTILQWETVGVNDQSTIDQQLADDAFEQEARAELATLQAKIDAVGYDKGEHERVKGEFDTLKNVPERWGLLQAAEAAIEPLDASIADAEKQLSSEREKVDVLGKRVIEEEVRLTSLQKEAGDLRAAEDVVTTLREKQIEANRKVGSAQQRVTVLDDLENSQKNLTDDRVALTEQIQKLKQLEKACGRDGIQALLIEQALPSIEESANELLLQLSEGNEMRIAFETQRKLKSKKKELRETLDINITDGQGLRPYENFSGGEQFRINFAIRLALSKLLASRAGAKLQTLVIDEGFGSQDPTGRQRLIRAINVIKPDFERILVITHIDELREVFPTRIEVRKTGAGSQVAVV